MPPPSVGRGPVPGSLISGAAAPRSLVCRCWSRGERACPTVGNREVEVAINRQWQDGPLSARQQLAERHPRAGEGGYRLVGVLLGMALVLAGTGMVAGRALGPARCGVVSLAALVLLAVSAVFNRRQKRAFPGTPGDQQAVS